MLAAPHIDGGIGIDERTRLVEPPRAAPHQAGHHEGLRLATSLDEAPLDQQRIEPPFAHRRPGYALAARSPARPSAARAVSTMCLALRRAWSYCAIGVSWSMKRSGSTIGRILSP